MKLEPVSGATLSPVCLTAAVVLTICCGIAGALHAQSKLIWAQEPDSFHGAKFLGTEAEARTNLAFSSCRDEQAYHEKLCLFHLNLAEVQITGLAILSDEKLVSVSGVFPADQLPTLSDVFEEKYGKALVFKGEEKQWKGRRVSLCLRGKTSVAEKDLIQRLAELLFSQELSAVSRRFAEDTRTALDAYMRKGDLALRLYKLNGSRYEYDAANEKAEKEYDERRKEAERQSERRNSEAHANLERFKTGSYGAFSLATNEYAESIRKRTEEQKKKAVGVL